MTESAEKQLLSRRAFARLAGVSPPAVTKACRKALAPACEGSMVDANHPAALEYRSRVHPKGSSTARAPTVLEPRSVNLTDAELEAVALRLFDFLGRRLRAALAL